MCIRSEENLISAQHDGNVRNEKETCLDARRDEQEHDEREPLCARFHSPPHLHAPLFMQEERRYGGHGCVLGRDLPNQSGENHCQKTSNSSTRWAEQRLSLRCVSRKVSGLQPSAGTQGRQEANPFRSGAKNAGGSLDKQNASCREICVKKSISIAS